MICFECEQDSLVDAEIHPVGTRYGEEFVVTMRGQKCGNCGFETVDSKQSGALTILVSDAYREAHRLLTTKGIRLRRSVLGMSQQQFADYLGVGVASVKRWESGQIQEKAMDELIRLKTDVDSARRNLRSLEKHAPRKCVLSTVSVGNHDMQFSIFFEQHFESHARMKVDTSELLPKDCIDQLSNAA